MSVKLKNCAIDGSCRYSLSFLSTSQFSGTKLSLLGEALRFLRLNADRAFFLPFCHFLIINFYQGNIFYRTNATPSHLNLFSRGNCF